MSRFKLAANKMIKDSHVKKMGEISKEFFNEIKA